MRSTADAAVSTSQRKLAVYLLFRDLGISHHGAMFLMRRVPMTDVIVDDEGETRRKRRGPSSTLRFIVFLALVALSGVVGAALLSAAQQPFVLVGWYLLSVVNGYAWARWLLVQ